MTHVSKLSKVIHLSQQMVILSKTQWACTILIKVWEKSLANHFFKFVLKCIKRIFLVGCTRQGMLENKNHMDVKAKVHWPREASGWGGVGPSAEHPSLLFTCLFMCL